MPTEPNAEVGSLDAPSFLATLLDWQVSSYQETIGDLVRSIDELDEIALRGTEAPEKTLASIVAIRRRIAWLRGLLAPHQHVYFATRKA